MDAALVRVRLDRGVANPEWKLLFPNAIVRHIVVASSDHMGLLVDGVPGPAQTVQRRRRLFRFEHTWVREPGYEDVIRGAWNSAMSGSPMFCLTQKIKECRVQLLKWSQAQVRATPNLIANKKVQLQELESQPMNLYNGQAVNNLRHELTALMLKEETLWRQRSRNSWLKEGDQNTRFFHESASLRHKVNTISRLMDANNS